MADIRDPAIAVAVLFERLDNVIAKLDDLSMKLDRHNTHRDQQMEELDKRVQDVEQSIDRARWFLFGVAAAGGAVGGSIASFLTKTF